MPFAADDFVAQQDNAYVCTKFKKKNNNNKKNAYLISCLLSSQPYNICSGSMLLSTATIRDCVLHQLSI